MSTLDEANRFVNCVMNRYRSDTVVRTGATLLLIIMPLIALVFGSIYKVISSEETGDEIVFLGFTAGFMFYYVVMIVMFMMYRRLIDHSARDAVWREALMRYAASRGCDISGMHSIDVTIKYEERTLAEWPAIILMAIGFLVFAVVGGIPKKVGFSDTTDGTHLIVLILVSIVLCTLVFAFVFLYTLRFPHMHESNQISFTEEFSRQMYARDVQMLPMKQVVTQKSIVLSIILFVITGGLFGLWMIYCAYTDANNHIQNQWSYENRIMNKIIRGTGGTGIAAGRSGVSK